MISELRPVIAPRLASPAAPDRALYLLSPILFPLQPGPAAETSRQERGSAVIRPARQHRTTAGHGRPPP